MTLRQCRLTIFWKLEDIPRFECREDIEEGNSRGCERAGMRAEAGAGEAQGVITLQTQHACRPVVSTPVKGADIAGRPPRCSAAPLAAPAVLARFRSVVGGDEAAAGRLDGGRQPEPAARIVSLSFHTPPKRGCASGCNICCESRGKNSAVVALRTSGVAMGSRTSRTTTPCP